MYYLLAGVELAVFVNVLICHSGVHLSRIVHSTVTYVLQDTKRRMKNFRKKALDNEQYFRKIQQFKVQL